MVNVGPMALVQKLIKKFGTNDPYEICSRLDILVTTLRLVNVRGFYHFANNTHFIYLSDELADHEKRFVLAHELCHTLLHSNDNALYLEHSTFLVTNKLENEANEFAVCLLFPDDDTLGELDDGLTISQLSAKLGISPAALAYRLSLMKK
ncbi:MAG: ImmA/IrrE family metallo-endopeptidase [Oscillospiraceae bacterium]